MDIGIECCYLMAGPHPSEFTCFGGNFISGRTTSVRTYNMVGRTIATELGNLVRQRILLKGCCNNGNVFIFGGDEGNSCEECCIEDREFKIRHYQGEDLLKTMTKDYSHST